VQARLRDPEILRNLRQRRVTRTGHCDYVAAELRRERFGHVDHPSGEEQILTRQKSTEPGAAPTVVRRPHEHSDLEASGVQRGYHGRGLEPFGACWSHVDVRQYGPQLAERAAMPDERPTFESVYASQRGGMVRLAYVIVGSKEVAEELTQEAFARLHQRWDQVENPVAFLRTVVTNLCRSEARRAERERRRVAESSIAIVGDPEIDETWALVCRLPFRQRAVLALRYYADLPEAEIAEILDCRLGTVKSTHHRAIAKLREELS
jgi:RNA polymerase sigma factor (sigma-70 family)